jgi:hypothetical protein
LRAIRSDPSALVGETPSGSSVKAAPSRAVSCAIARSGSGGLDQSGADVVPEPEVAARGFGLARAGLCPWLLVLGGGVAERVIVDPGAG